MTIKSPPDNGNNKGGGVVPPSHHSSLSSPLLTPGAYAVNETPVVATFVHDDAAETLSSAILDAEVVGVVEPHNHHASLLPPSSPFGYSQHQQYHENQYFSSPPPVANGNVQGVAHMMQNNTHQFTPRYQNQTIFVQDFVHKPPNIELIYDEILNGDTLTIDCHNPNVECDENPIGGLLVMLLFVIIGACFIHKELSFFFNETTIILYRNTKTVTWEDKPFRPLFRSSTRNVNVRGVRRFVGVLDKTEKVNDRPIVRYSIDALDGNHIQTKVLPATLTKRSEALYIIQEMEHHFGIKERSKEFGAVEQSSKTAC